MYFILNKIYVLESFESNQKCDFLSHCGLKRRSFHKVTSEGVWRSENHFEFEPSIPEIQSCGSFLDKWFWRIYLAGCISMSIHENIQRVFLAHKTNRSETPSDGQNSTKFAFQLFANVFLEKSVI